MNKHFIQQIHIKNFKCFDDFKAKGFGRVNLIGGKNNVGKTVFMEACYVNVHAQDIYSFVSVLNGIKLRRESLNLLFEPEGFKSGNKIQQFIEQSHNIYVASNINAVSYKIKNKEGIKTYHFEFKSQNINVNVNAFSFERIHIPNIQFIDNFGQANFEMISNYSAVQKLDKEDSLNIILNTFDPNIETFKIIDEKPQCKSNGQYREITEFGDGVRHLVSIVTSLYASEDGYLFIDEIDNGVHYSLLEELWTNILKLSKQLNVQIFATTHSKECIESFNRAQKVLKDKDSHYFEMARNIKTNQIFMRDLNDEQLQYELTHQGKYRGE
ncbi:MAG: AAA family ATPase [Methylococcales bacterium]|nr:AAA family ATPase [Methylococcales bacterium]